MLFLFFANSYGVGSEAYHSFLVGSSICIVSIDGGRESFLWPVISGDKVVVDEASGCSGVNKGLGVDNLT